MWKQLTLIFAVLAYVNADLLTDAEGACACKPTCESHDFALNVPCPQGDQGHTICCTAEFGQQAMAMLQNVSPGGAKRLARSSAVRDVMKRLSKDNHVQDIVRSKEFKRMARKSTMDGLKEFTRSSVARNAFKRMARDGTFKRWGQEKFVRGLVARAPKKLV